MGQKFQYDLGQALTEVGLTFVQKNNLGQPVVRDNDTDEEFIYDLDADLRQLGVNKEDAQVVFNTQDNPIAISPLSVSERAKLGVGNTRGGIKFLRNKFQAVVPTEDHGLLVLDKGVWKQTDPSGLGDGNAWEMAKELAKDVADLSDIGINIAATSAALGVAATTVTGTAGLGTPAAIATVGAAGAVSGKIRTSLGRYFGTYEATPEEELTDIGLESIFSLGGQAIGAGVRPALQALIKSSRKVGSSAIANSAAAVYGRITGVGSGAMQTLFSKGSSVGTSMTSAIKKAGPGASTDTAIDIAKQRAIDGSQKLFTEATEALPRQYGKILDNVVAKADKSKLSVNMNTVLDDSFTQLKEAGLGIVEQKGNQKLFRSFTEAEKVARIESNLEVFDLDEVAERQISSLVKTLQRFSTGKTLKGGLAANRLVAANKALNNQLNKTFEGQAASPEFRAAVARATKGFRTSVGKQFDDAGLGKEYIKLAELYKEFSSSVAQARKLKESVGGTESFLNRLSTDAGRNLEAKGVSKKLVELTGKRGQQLFEEISVNDAASKFLRWAPKMGLVQTGLIGGGAGAAFTGGLAISPLTGLGLSQFSPRLVSGQFRAMKFAAEHLKFLKNLGPKQMQILLDSPAIFDGIVRTTAAAIGQEEADTQSLLEDAGVNNRDQ